MSRPAHAGPGLAADRRADRGRGGVAPRWLGGVGTGLARMSRRRRTTMLATKLPAGRGAWSPSPRPAWRSAGLRWCDDRRQHRRPPLRRQPPATSGEPAADTGYSGPPVTIEYAIWGDPAEINSQKAVVEGFTAANPNITVDVTVADWDAYWDKLQTGLAGGAAPDVFAMDGPLGPDYQSRDVLLDLTPYIEARGLRPRPAGRQRASRTSRRGRRRVRPAARPQRDRALLQQGHVRRGRHRLPGRHLDRTSWSRSASS